MKAQDGDGFTIEHRWKEEVIYWEDDQGFLVDGGWGVTPAALYVPSEEIWHEVMPAWLRDRRDVVLARLATCGDELIEDVHGHYRIRPENRSLRR